MTVVKRMGDGKIEKDNGKGKNGEGQRTDSIEGAKRG